MYRENHRVQVHNSLKVPPWAAKVVSGRSKGQEVTMRLYWTLGRLYLEFCLQFWLPHYRYNVETFESIQKKFTRIMPGVGAFFPSVENQILECIALRWVGQTLKEVWGASFYLLSIVSGWNVPPGVVFKAEVVVAFKRLLDRHMDIQGMERNELCTSR